MTKKSFANGTIADYRDNLSKFTKNGETFETISSGLTRRIVLPNGAKIRFFGTEQKGQVIDGAFLVQMVQKEIDSYIAKNGIPEHQQIHDVQMFDISLIQKKLLNKPKPVIGIDINACYWNTAHKLGYISDSLYERGLKAAKKKGLLISIGCLNKKPIIKKYQNGKLISTRFDEEVYKRYSPFYWNIIAETQKIMVESYLKFKGNWYMYLTDCLFVDPTRMKEAQQFLSDLGFSSKIHQIQFTRYDGFKLFWYDFKDQKEKVMYVGNRDMINLVDEYKKKREAQNAPLANN
jgi:hypothetical protein